MFSVTCYYFETEDSEFSIYRISNKYYNFSVVVAWTLNILNELPFLL